MALRKKNDDFEEILHLIESAKARAYQKVNEELVRLYFNVGGIVSLRVSQGIWGESTVDDLADYIEKRFPGMKGFNRRGLYRMKQFYDTYTDPAFVSPLVTQLQNPENEIVEIVSPAVTQLDEFEKRAGAFVSSVLTKISWTHHLLILSKAKLPEEKMFYIHQCIREKLSKRELERQLNSATFERTVLANQKLTPEILQLPKNLFKDPYIFEFLDLPEGHSEKDLETALVKNLQKFILEIGKGFTYMGSQFRMQVGNKDYHTDLLFYHRDLQCLVLFELKIQEFEPEFLGKLNFYLEALDRDVKRPHEKPSIGILLCKGKDTEVVEYALARSSSPAMIADYETKLIPKDLLAKKLNQLVEELSATD
jgi:predicted nuclease of restriction endonuclease-like (RecB) superfamily